MESKAVSVLKVRIGAGDSFPDPADISSAGKWYFLDHVSTGLIRFDHAAVAFIPALAENWSSDESGVHTFTIRKDAVFDDGTPITAHDAEASIKRLLVKKTSTHFPLWEYIEGCENLTTIADACSGVKAVDAHTLQIKLKIKIDSFYLQLASPETGIWWKGDLLQAGPFKPTKFSGPYAVSRFENGGAIIKRNPTNPISKAFPNSPREIDLLSIPGDKANQALIDGKIDLQVRTHDPMGEPNWAEHGVSVFGSTPSTLLYLQGSSKAGQQMIGQDFLETIWNYTPANEAFPADTFLPQSLGYALSKDTLLKQFPPKSSKVIRVGVPWTYFSQAFLARIQTAAKEIGTDLRLVTLSQDAWFDACDRKGDLSGFDYVLIPYAASERYPAVQLRYIAGTGTDLPFDLKKAESPGLTQEKIKILKDTEEWFSHKQHTVPLYFLRSQITYSAKLNVGDQPPNDAESSCGE